MNLVLYLLLFNGLGAPVLRLLYPCLLKHTIPIRENLRLLNQLLVLVTVFDGQLLVHVNKLLIAGCELAHLLPEPLAGDVTTLDSFHHGHSLLCCLLFKLLDPHIHSHQGLRDHA